jgi:hypothetical protein
MEDNELNLLVCKYLNIDCSTKPEHSWKLNDLGDIDYMAYSEGYCNGPYCIRCSYSYCEACILKKDIKKECILCPPNFCRGFEIELILNKIEEQDKQIHFIKIITELESTPSIYAKFKAMYNYPLVVKAFLICMGEIFDS